MVPIADNSATAGRATGPGMTSPDRADPVRAVVHVLLAIYLSPVILAVCLIGAASILAGGAARIVGKLGGKSARGGPTRAGRPGRGRGERNKPRLIDRRERSRSPR